MFKQITLKQLLSKPAFIFCIYILVSITVTLIKVSIDFKPHIEANYISKINNYIIYQNSFYHLISHSNLYGFFPTEQYDEFLYSPTFALLFAPFAVLPKYIGVVIWAIFNTAVVFVAIKKLTIDESKKVFILWFVLIELTTGIQSQQVNVLVAGLFLLTFTAFEKRSAFWAAFFIVLSTFIKIYGILGFSLFLLYPDKIKFIAYSILWSVVLFLIPVLAISFNELLILYQNWFTTLVGDHAINQDISVMRLLSNIYKPQSYEVWITSIQLIAVVLFCIKYIRIKAYQNTTFRFFFLASIMIWSVIYSHAAESSTYIIAVCGVAVWYTMDIKNKWTLLLIIFVFVLTSLSPTDLYPRFIRVNYIAPMALKALPCFIVWIKLEYDMLFRKDLEKLIA